jgi:hypothetical protein
MPCHPERRHEVPKSKDDEGQKRLLATVALSAVEGRPRQSDECL